MPLFMREPVGMLRPAICLMACAWPALVLAAPPTISKLSVRGLQVGGATRVVVNGANLLPSPRVVAGVPVAAQKVVGTPTANVVMFDVTLDGSVFDVHYLAYINIFQGFESNTEQGVHLKDRYTPITLIPRLIIFCPSQ